MKRASVDVVYMLALWAMCIAIPAGTLTSLFESRTDGPRTMEVVTNVALFVWVGCGVVLWLKAWGWLLRTWSARATIYNTLWLLAILFGSIILPVLAYKRFVKVADYDRSNQRRPGEV